MNGNNSLTLGHLPQVNVFNAGFITHDHTQNRSLTCGKDRVTNSYSLIIMQNIH